MLALIYMVVIGMFAGIVTGLTGGSGVMVVVPLLNFLLNLSVHICIGVSLIVDVVTSIAVTYVYKEYGNIDLGSGIWIALGSIVGAQLGALSVTAVSGWGLGELFGISMVLTGYFMWKKGSEREYLALKLKEKFGLKNINNKVYIAILLGFLIGIVTGVLGAGGGLMIFLVLILVLDYPIHLAIGTSTLIMAITASSGALGYAVHGNTNLYVALIVGIGAVTGGVGSAKLANRVNEDILVKLISTVFFILGALMMIINLL